MAEIGTLTQTRDGGWAGSIFLLAQWVKIKLIPNDNQTNPKAPAFRIFSGAADMGALWVRKTKDEDQQDFLSGEIECLGLAEPIQVAVFISNDGARARVIWKRHSDYALDEMARTG
jgi:uncharacterized protein (DUF736 family)